MTAWKLPTSLNIGGVVFRIRTDFRDILKIIKAFNDPELKDWMKIQCMIVILYPDYHLINDKNIMEAVMKGKEFIDYGKEKSSSLKTMDWEQDAKLIISEINKNTKAQDIRMVEYMHWWTFLGYYMGIGESLFSQIVNIRTKRQQGKKLEKWESEFYRRNKDLVDFKSAVSEEQREKRKAEQLAVDALFY